MISRIFIDRPVFAWVIAIIIMLAGIAGILSLPVEQYPDIAPPSVNVRASYPGASAETVETSVTQVIEQQLTGINGMIYFSATSNSSGLANITVTFQKGINPDIAQVQVQNKVQQALPRLPQQVQQQGLVVTKSNPDFLMVVGIYDETDRSRMADVADYLVSNLQDPLARVPGVGDIIVFGAQHCDADLARSVQAGQLLADAARCDHRDPGAKCAGRGRPDRRPTVAEQPDAQCDGDGAVTAQRSRPVPQHHRQDPVGRFACAAARRCADRARQRELWRGGPAERPSGVRHRHPARTGADALKTAKLVRDEIARRAPSFPPATRSPIPTTAPPSSGFRSSRW